MTKTIIWIRHGCVRQHPSHDVLTEEGELFASRLPKLLQEHSIEPDVVFFDVSEDSSRGGDSKQILGEPKRCRETVRAFGDHLKDRFTCSTHAEAEQRLIKFASKGQVIVVCYKTESFLRLRRIQRCKFENYMGQDINLEMPDKSVKDELYDNILVTSFDGTYLICHNTIPTGMRCVSALVDARS